MNMRPILFCLLAGSAAAGLWLALCPAQTAPAQRAGIAANYPGDTGIAKDPNVIFADSFETGTVADIGKRWGLIDPPDGRTLALSDDAPAGTAGKRSLQVTQTMGENAGGYLYTTFPGVDQAYLRFYVKFAPDHAYEHHFVELGGYNPPLAWPFPKAGTRPNGNDRMMVFVDAVGDYGKYPPPGIWSLYTYWPEMKISADKAYWGNCINPAVPQQIVRGKWQCVEVMVKMNSAPDKADGELALWLDGSEVMRVSKGTPRALWSGMGFDVLKSGGEPFEGFRFRTDNALKINHLWLEHYLGQGEQQQNRFTNPSKVNRVWFDDVVVAKSYIGPHGR